MPLPPTNLHAEAIKRGIKIPTKRTLTKYGLTEITWLMILERQGWKCPICEVSQAHWNIDHCHVPGWSKLTPEGRALHVRGVTCWRCNHYQIPNVMSAADGSRLAKYLADYESRRGSAV